MRGLVLVAPHDVRLRDDLPDPGIEAPTDVVIAVARTGLCGSDLHPYEGRERVRPGVVPGHEAVGEVVAVGVGVRHHHHLGARVVVPFTTSCGSCAACADGVTSRCERGQLFGFGDPDDLDAPALHGGQAELLRVPLADTTAVALPEGVDDATGVLLTDNLPTGWTAALRAEVTSGDAVGVVGLGSVGLCTIVAARALGAAHVVAVDPVDARRDIARRVGADVAVTPEQAWDAATNATDGRGLAAVVDATGATEGQRLALDLLRPAGRLSVIAVQTAAALPFSPTEAYDRDLTVRFGRAPVRALLDALIARVAAGDLVVPTEHILTAPGADLADGPDLYRRFAARDAGLVKAAFAP